MSIVHDVRDPSSSVRSVILVKPDRLCNYEDVFIGQWSFTGLYILLRTNWIVITNRIRPGKQCHCVFPNPPLFFFQSILVNGEKGDDILINLCPNDAKFAVAMLNLMLLSSGGRMFTCLVWCCPDSFQNQQLSL